MKQAEDKGFKCKVSIRSYAETVYRSLGTPSRLAKSNARKLQNFFYRVDIDVPDWDDDLT
jgi:hypothetical protein